MESIYSQHSSLFKCIFATFDFEILMPPAWFKKSLCQSVKTLNLYATHFCATPKNLMPPPGMALKKKTNAPHPKIWKLANLGGVGVVGVVVRGGFYNDLEIGFEGYPRKAL